MTVCNGNIHSPLPFIPLGELLTELPAPNSSEADYTEYKDIKSLVARDPNVAATITSVSLGMVMAGVINDGKPKARDILVAVKQIENDIRRHQEEMHKERKKAEHRHMITNDTLLAEEVKKDQEKDKGLFSDFFTGGKSPFANLLEVMTDEKPEKCELVYLPRFAWDDVSVGTLGTGTSAPNVMLCHFRKNKLALAA